MANSYQQMEQTTSVHEHLCVFCTVSSDQKLEDAQDSIERLEERLTNVEADVDKLAHG